MQSTPLAVFSGFSGSLGGKQIGLTRGLRPGRGFHLTDGRQSARPPALLGLARFISCHQLQREDKRLTSCAEPINRVTGGDQAGLCPSRARAPLQNVLYFNFSGNAEMHARHSRAQKLTQAIPHTKIGPQVTPQKGSSASTPSVG